MAVGKAEQLDTSTKSSFRKTRAFIKRQTAKARRRQEKKMLDETPPRHYKGWLS